MTLSYTLDGQENVTFKNLKLLYENFYRFYFWQLSKINDGEIMITKFIICINSNEYNNNAYPTVLKG